MGFIRWILESSGRPRPIVRWSSEELAEKKRYLEDKPSSQFTRQDYELLIEWLFQRYLPKHYVMTEKAWTQKKTVLMSRIDKNIEAAKSSTATPWAPGPPREKYVLSRKDFESAIVPCLLRFSFFVPTSTPDWQGGTFGEAYWLIASHTYSDQSEGRSRITGKCDDFAIAQLIREHCHPFETIMNARLAGSTLVQVSPAPQQCPACSLKVCRNESIDELLESFRRGAPPFPHEIMTEDTNDWCRSPIVVPAIEPRPGDDLDFHRWLVAELSNPGDITHAIDD
jgi:hypothetical protein